MPIQDEPVLKQEVVAIEDMQFRLMSNPAINYPLLSRFLLPLQSNYARTWSGLRNRFVSNYKQMFLKTVRQTFGRHFSNEKSQFIWWPPLSTYLLLVTYSDPPFTKPIKQKIN
jgi:hypothetical protein